MMLIWWEAWIVVMNVAIGMVLAGATFNVTARWIHQVLMNAKMRELKAELQRNALRAASAAELKAIEEAYR